ncbi:MAG: hypothetical protein Q7U16_06910 [Agitococcus sp.]|nr:hypothetical protein [Agitococcus sp.]
MSMLKNTIAIIALVISPSFALCQGTMSAPNLAKKTQLYVGIEPCNNGEVTTYEKHKGCGTQKVGYTIDDASATPIDSFTKVYSGNDTVNYKIVSKNSNHLGGSMESIGYLSKSPIPGGVEIRSGNEPCNNGTATTSTRHLGCGTEFLGYTIPQD